MDDIHREYGVTLRYAQDYQKRLSIIREVLVCEGITKKYDKNGILGDCNISSQYAISFLRTFTE